MRNFHSPGNTLTLVAPSGGVTSGQPVLIGSIFAVAGGDAAEGDMFEGAVAGVYDLPRRVADSAWLAGLPVYFDVTNGELTTSSTAGDDVLVGVAVAPAASDATTGLVRLLGQALAP